MGSFILGMVEALSRLLPLSLATKFLLIHPKPHAYLSLFLTEILWSENSRQLFYLRSSLHLKW
jgi:hypothetical protein